METMLERIRILEPQAQSFVEGVNSYIVLLGESGGKVLLSKKSLEGMQKSCLTCKQTIRLFYTPQGWRKFNLDGTRHNDLRRYKK